MQDEASEEKRGGRAFYERVLRSSEYGEETRYAAFFGLARSISYMHPRPEDTQTELRELVAAFDAVYPETGAAS